MFSDCCVTSLKKCQLSIEASHTNSVLNVNSLKATFEIHAHLNLQSHLNAMVSGDALGDRLTGRRTNTQTNRQTATVHLPPHDRPSGSLTYPELYTFVASPVIQTSSA